MKYNKRLSIILGILFAAILFCMADNVWDIPTEQNKEKAITENGKDTLINAKK